MKYENVTMKVLG